MSKDFRNNPLSFERLREAVQHDAAIRLRTRLEPAGGPGDNVFPAIYPKENGQKGGLYAIGSRWLDGDKVERSCSIRCNRRRIEWNLPCRQRMTVMN